MTDFEDTPLPDSDRSHETRSGLTPEQVSEYLLFALSQLAGENGHHKFENLCYHLASRRIYSNVIPSTGPVSAGGDQGSDFETYQVGDLSVVGPISEFFGQATREKVVFACSLEKDHSGKIKKDLSAVAKFSVKVEKLVFMSNHDIPIGKRHKILDFALQTHGVHLEIFDARAISKMLSDSELFWIAQEYLSIPSQIMLAMPRSTHTWYESALVLNIDPAELITSDFFSLRDAVRFATRNHAHHSDIPGLLTKLRLFRQHHSQEIQRRAFYEDFVASLRGLGKPQGFESGLEEYITVVAAGENPAELEDASVLIGYAIGALLRGLLNLELSAVGKWRTLLLKRIDYLLNDKEIGSGRKCSLLYTQGFLLLNDWIDAPPDSQRIPLDATKSIAAWRKVIKEVQRAPLFPLDRFGRLLARVAGHVEDTKDFSRLVAETDKLLSRRSGKHKLAELAFDRATSYYEAKRVLEAISELHEARVEAFTEETVRDSVQFCIFLAKMYSEIGLHFAAKCYALAAAFAALKLKDDSLKALSYRGFTEAAASDHASGASMGFFLSARLFFIVSQEFSMSGTEQTKEFEWGRIDFYSLILTRAAFHISEPLHTYLKDTVLKSFGADEIYVESSSRLDDFFKPGGLQSAVEKSIQEGIMPPFSDAGKRRRVGWQQLGVRWFIDWPNDYDTARLAESFCASLQILLAELRETELSIVPSDVFISVRIHDGKLQMENNSDNERILLVARLPKVASPEDDTWAQQGIVHGVATSALMAVSAMPQEQFFKLYTSKIKTGLLARLSPYAEYVRLFREFYGEADFAQHYGHSLNINLELPQVATKTDIALSGPTGPHPEYNSRTSARVIRRRYKLLAGQLKYSLPRLLGDPVFLTTIRTLRGEGWKDWHILQAAASIRLNYLLNATVPHATDFETMKGAANELYQREERASDPATPAGWFSAEGLRQALSMSQLSTLKGWGFESPQRTPNFEGVNRFLERFNYWTDDIAHPTFFPE
jgi:hypothetical protein